MNFLKVSGFVILVALIACTSCNKTPNCEDGKQNYGERGIDCSGPCPDKCDCFDGIANFGEEGVDCGGPFCKPCTSCQDGEQNGDETDIDCGGETCPPCELDCPLEQDLANMATYTIDNLDFGTSSANAFIGPNNELIIKTQNADDDFKLQINQAKPGFGVGDYDIKNQSVTYVFTEYNSNRYDSEINGSEGFFEITEFVNETDCKYLSASFNMVLANSNGLQKITLVGLFSEVEFNQ